MTLSIMTVCMLKVMTLSIMTLSIMKHCKMTPSIITVSTMTLSIMTLSIMTLSIMKLFIMTLSIMTLHHDTYLKGTHSCQVFYRVKLAAMYRHVRCHHVVSQGIQWNGQVQNALGTFAPKCLFFTLANNDSFDSCYLKATQSNLWEHDKSRHKVG